MNHTAEQRAMWDRLEAEKNALKAEFGERVDRLYEKTKLEVEQVYGNAKFETGGQDILLQVPNSSSLLDSPEQLDSIHQQNVDHNSTSPPAGQMPISSENINHVIIENDSSAFPPIDNHNEQQIHSVLSSSLTDVPSNSQPRLIHHELIQTETNSTNPVPFNSPNLSHSSDQSENMQPNLMSLASLTDQNTTEMQQIKQEFTDDSSINRNEQSNVADVVKHEHDSDCDDGICHCDDSDPVQSNEPSTSNRRQSNPVSSKQSNASTSLNLTKRKATEANRIVKRSKNTNQEDDEQNMYIANDDRGGNKIKVVHLNCTQQNCQVKLQSLDQLYVHLRTSHGLLSFRCFALNCNSRCDNRPQMIDHIKQHHSNSTNFVCYVCHKNYTSQRKSSIHWNRIHLTGQFQCNLDDCTELFDNRMKVHDHQERKHGPESKRFKCRHVSVGCSSTFATKIELERHEMTHLNRRPFRCTQCSHRANRRSQLVKHIRTQHFGLPTTLKKQMEMNIVDGRDPNDYIRVAEEDE